MTNHDSGIQSLGRDLLIKWMASGTGRSQGYIAKKLGVSQPAVRNWVVGTSRPEPHFRDALQALCGIPPSAWELEVERQQRETALHNIAESYAVPESGPSSPETKDAANG